MTSENVAITKTDPPLSNSHPFLESKGLTRNFGGLVAVNQVSFTVNANEIFGLIGPNGAGKTTLFNMITGLVPPSSGQLIYQGEEITQLRADQIAAKGIARTFQNIRLFGDLSAWENVMIGRHIKSRHTSEATALFRGLFGLPPTPTDEKETKQKALELLNLVGLGDRALEKAKNFAYGDQRRLEIARALALEPQILLLDEPAAGMNPNEKHQLSEFIRDIRHQFNLTVILIEHHVPLVMGLCHRIAVLDFGQLIALGEPSEVKNNPAVIEAYLGDE
ncbi:MULTISPECIES: ABC transporter ATP-binding protein [Planktothricoides]|uniref:ABC transporter ATP-binding protein n=2 Tax=Planktothricoides raciborskii TaxID=132608 RepID=A0AAU8J955_9CYAN|nr:MULTISPECIES: ABC transporter ATP-binding protein [Planktothricoides]KOR37502.1 leucine/isoleucine/valine transporter ATP-binding subunit [Planktothricoides sp. SR001]MBD2543040.1 ABC transporter ATP-binding protein [Planktothricoides raciborskii FACHB-1370]MBD2581919.1 ABC transporter ATP-binding protein [Planktothricoides raciborskii FACHB-1261]